MLAPKVSNRSTRQSLLISAILCAAFTLVESNALAADILPTGQMDASSVGNVSSAETSKNGTMKSGISFQNTSSVLKDSNINSEARLLDQENEVLRDSSRMTAYFGTSITNDVEFTLGLHGTHEIASPESRDTYFVNSIDEDQEEVVQEDWRESTKESGFSGASLAMKVRLVYWKGLQVAVAPFIESGIGERGSYSYTRSVNPKSGWSVITSYGQKGVAELTLQGGYRYRDPETVGDITLRNEMFGGVNAKVWLSRGFALFGGGQGRNLNVANNGDFDENGKLIYAGQESGEVNGGFIAKFDETQLSAFVGSKIDKSAGFGYSSASAGFSISYELGNYHGRLPRAGFAAQVQEGVKDKEGFVEVKKAEPSKEEYKEMKGKDIDPLANLKNDTNEDDFVLVKKKVDAQIKDTSESDDALISKELSTIREKDKEEKEAERQQVAKELEESRAKQRVQQKEDAELMKQWTQEAQEEQRESDGISKDEMEWNGLDHH
jgi:hypothetical protein